MPAELDGSPATPCVVNLSSPISPVLLSTADSLLTRLASLNKRLAEQSERLWSQPGPVRSAPLVRAEDLIRALTPLASCDPPNNNKIPPTTPLRPVVTRQQLAKSVVCQP